MSNDVIEVSRQDNSLVLPVTQADVEALKKQRELLKDFIASQLREANFKDSNAKDFGDGDYGVIPGTKKKTLLKPGAEKILRLFGLGVRVRQVDKDFDRHANFAIITYRAEVYPLRNPDVVVAECEATANSQEVKYKERTTWKTNKKGVREATKEETPISDILNTLMKMAQKRAIIGATILATAASDYFHPEEENDGLPPKGRKTEEGPNNATTEGPNISPEKAPECCGNEMMISKYVEKDGAQPWYCVKCKTKKPRN